MKAIILENASKTYPGSSCPAVRDFCLEVAEGSIVSLLGPSGCGKTTTLRLIAGLERPDSGRIILAGKTVAGGSIWVPPERRCVGMVFQDPTLFPHLNVANNVGFNYNWPDRPHRIRELLGLVGLAGYANRFAHELSGGQQQRVALARALARRPVVVLLDEPFSSLEPALRVHMRLEMKRIIGHAGATAVFVTHDRQDALAISDRLVVICGGVIQQEGTPRDICRFPANRFVAEFLQLGNTVPGIVGPGGKHICTSLGTFPCFLQAPLVPGATACVSLSPAGWIRDDGSPVQGRVQEVAYMGEFVEAKVELELSGSCRTLTVRLEPSEVLRQGQVIGLRAPAGAVPVIGGRAAAQDSDRRLEEDLAEG